LNRERVLLVNTLGHSAGVLIFGIFLVLLVRDRCGQARAGGVKSILAALLALVWNVASLIVLRAAIHLIRGSFASPSQSVLGGEPAAGGAVRSVPGAARYRPLVRSGYVLSGLATVCMWRNCFAKLELSPLGADVDHAGVRHPHVDRGDPWSIATEHDRATTSRVVGTMSLFLLAMSFVHLGSGHAQQIWSQELAFHHAAIHLALLVLLQDYRFLCWMPFSDSWQNVLLAAVFVFAAVAAWRYELLPAADTPFHVAL
jgi:hypothetical protein